MIWADELNQAQQIGLGMLFLISLLPAIYYAVSIYRLFVPHKRKKGEEVVTYDDLLEIKQEIKQDHYRFVSRDELLASPNSPLQVLISQVKEHGIMLHEVSEFIHNRDTQIQGQLNQIGLKLETDLGSIRERLAVIEDRLDRNGIKH